MKCFAPNAHDQVEMKAGCAVLIRELRARLSLPTNSKMIRCFGLTPQILNLTHLKGE